MSEQKVKSKELDVIFHQQFVANATQVSTNFKFKDLLWHFTHHLILSHLEITRPLIKSKYNSAIH